MAKEILIDEVITLASDLINRPSMTPHDAGCQKYIAEFLQPLGFNSQHLRFADVDNLWACLGTAKPLLTWVGHTDVVPPGPLEQWSADPFKAEIRQQRLYGRGSADMKGSIASMLVACKHFVMDHPKFQGSIAFLITSDEEGPSINGTAKVVEWLQQQNTIPNYCLVGEPSSEQTLGDTLKIGRRGSLHGTLKIHGIQGHVAYPNKASNPIHQASPLLDELAQLSFDDANEFFPASHLQISNIHAGTGALNVIPGEMEIKFNIRYNPTQTAEKLQHQLEQLFNKHKVNHSIHWNIGALPFLSKPGKLISACQTAIKELCAYTPTLSTIGGTSDGRFLAPLGCEVAELGPCNQTIHQINESVAITELHQLSLLYYEILRNLLRA